MLKEANPDWMPLFSERNGVGGRIKAWHKVADHPFFKECYAAEKPLLETMLAKLDEVHQWLTAMDESLDGLPIHRTEAGYPYCATCDGGGCLDCTDPAY